MSYIYLILSVLTFASSSIFGKMFTRRNGKKRDSGTFYNFFFLISVFLGWCVLYAINFTFDAGVLWYSVLFAICYTVTSIGSINALKHGPVALTASLVGLSLIFATVWGFFFWDAKVTVPVIIGLVLVVISILLCLYSKEKEKKAFSLKWLFYVSLAFFGNAGATIVQRTQQIQYGGQHGNMLMTLALGVSVIAYLFIYLKSDKGDSPAMLKSSWWIPVLAGIFNVALNALVMLLALTELSPSLIYPTINVGGLAVVTVFSLFVFKEKMYPRQWLGVAIGAVAVVLLSI